MTKRGSCHDSSKKTLTFIKMFIQKLLKLIDIIQCQCYLYKMIRQSMPEVDIPIPK